MLGIRSTVLVAAGAGSYLLYLRLARTGERAAAGPQLKRSACTACATAICFDCLQPFHPNLDCSEVEEHMITEWKKGKDAGQCPKCKAHIERSGGCNHMTCVVAGCRHEFCWLCGADYDRGRHFGNGGCNQYGGVRRVNADADAAPAAGGLWGYSMYWLLLRAASLLAALAPRLDSTALESAARQVVAGPWLMRVLWMLAASAVAFGLPMHSGPHIARRDDDDARGAVTWDWLQVPFVFVVSPVVGLLVRWVPVTAHPVWWHAELQSSSSSCQVHDPRSWALGCRQCRQSYAARFRDWQAAWRTQARLAVRRTFVLLRLPDASERPAGK
jgi:hypothetical protein